MTKNSVRTEKEINETNSMRLKEHAERAFQIIADEKKRLMASSTLSSSSAPPSSSSSENELSIYTEELKIYKCVPTYWLFLPKPMRYISI
jgi:hypothetical protein